MKTTQFWTQFIKETGLVFNAAFSWEQEQAFYFQNAPNEERVFSVVKCVESKFYGKTITTLMSKSSKSCEIIIKTQ